MNTVDIRLSTSEEENSGPAYPGSHRHRTYHRREKKSRTSISVAVDPLDSVAMRTWVCGYEVTVAAHVLVLCVPLLETGCQTEPDRVPDVYSELVLDHCKAVR